MKDRVEFRRVSKDYDGIAVVAPLDLSIAAGEFVVLLGPSGSGKTTLLNMIGGFASPSAGRVLIDGLDVTDLPPARRPTATVFQDYALFPHMSLAANVGFGLRMQGMGKAERQAKAEAMLELVGLKGFGKRGVHQLSGGQRQRVALARAMAVEPKVLLLDEPLGALDLALRRQMQEELVRLQKRSGATFVHVTHDQEEAMSIADRIVVVNKGRIEDMGPPSRVYLKPASLFAATFMGESNVLAGRVTESSGGEIKVETALGGFVVPGQACPDASVHLVLRPEQLQLSRPEQGIILGQARVEELSFQGTHCRCHCRIAGQDLILRAPVSTGLTAGQVVTLHAALGDVVVLGD
ncbi:ABC transporter ATP-binding protein [Dongia sp.]|uniref:ABC transporter ATP-binding protein n=1 Tax=Dongia sp. TaxID=1977262 RepID=UPI0035B3430B